MAFWKSKGKDGNAVPRKPGAGKPVRRNPKQMMSSVLDETSRDAISGILADDLFYRLDPMGGRDSLGLVFDPNAGDFGGLSKRTRGDETKGQLIEAINAGDIKVIFTGRLMEDDKLIIVPDEATVEALSEFGIMSRVSFGVCIVTASDNPDLGYDIQESEGMTLSYAQVRDAAERKESLAELLGGKDESDVTTVTDLSSPDIHDGVVADTTNDADNTMVSAPEPVFVPDEPEDMDLDELDLGPDLEPVEDDEAVDQDEPEPIEDEEPEEEGSEPEPEPETAIPDEVVNETLDVLFFSGDLDLSISTNEFDATFLHGTSPYAAFDTNRGEGFYDTELANIAREGNTDLESRHSANLFAMRTLYTRLMSEAVQAIGDEFDDADVSTVYGKIRAAFDQAYRERKGAEGAERDELVRKVNERWDAEVKAAGDTAAAVGMQQYRERFRRSHDDEISHINQAVSDGIESSHAADEAKLRDRRRKDAQLTLRQAQAKCMSDVQSEYERLLDEEKDAYDGWAKKLEATREARVTDDRLRTQALIEDQKRNDAVETANREAKARIEQMQAGYDTVVASLRSELQHSKDAAERHLSEVVEEKDQAISVEKSLRSQAETQLAKVRSDGDANVKQAYEEANKRVEMVTATSHQTSMMFIVGIVMVFVIALVLGLLLGKTVLA